MAQTPETRLANEIRLWCGEHDWLCFHALNGMYYTRDGRVITLDFPEGFPDLIIITNNGKVAFIETKIRPRKPTEKQLKFQEDLRNRGFVSTTVYDISEFMRVMRDTGMTTS